MDDREGRCMMDNVTRSGHTRHIFTIRRLNKPINRVGAMGKKTKEPYTTCSCCRSGNTECTDCAEYRAAGVEHECWRGTAQTKQIRWLSVGTVVVSVTIILVVGYFSTLQFDSLRP